VAAASAFVVIGSVQQKIGQLRADVDEIKTSHPDVVSDRLGRDETAAAEMDEDLRAKLRQMSDDLAATRSDVAYIRGVIDQRAKLQSGAFWGVDVAGECDVVAGAADAAAASRAAAGSTVARGAGSSPTGGGGRAGFNDRDLSNSR
jgi:hypothetical protein